MEKRKRGRPPKNKPKEWDKRSEKEIIKSQNQCVTRIISNQPVTVFKPIKEAVDEEQENKKLKREAKELEVIEELEFKKGQNFITIRFSKNKNRLFRIQIFLNDEIEIRPVTYSGSTTGTTFWKLLKGALK